MSVATLVEEAKSTRGFDGYGRLVVLNDAGPDDVRLVVNDTGTEFSALTYDALGRSYEASGNAIEDACRAALDGYLDILNGI